MCARSLQRSMPAAFLVLAGMCRSRRKPSPPRLKIKALSATTIIATWCSCFSASTRCVFANLIGGEKNSLGAKKKIATPLALQLSIRALVRVTGRESAATAIVYGLIRHHQVGQYQFSFFRAVRRVRSHRAEPLIGSIEIDFRSHLKLEENEPKCTRGTC